MRHRLASFSVLVGYKCNFRCAHCGVSEKRGTHLSREEILLLIETINKYRFQTIVFVGGEPTLYIDKINQILAGINYSPYPDIKITTNGHFAATKVSAARTLGRFKKLSGVQLSYDRFHKAFLQKKNLENLFSVCEEEGIGFNIMLAVQSPMDLLLLKELRRIGDFPVGIQPIHPIGAAQKNRVEHLYPSFDRSVLTKKCPSNDKMVYLCGEGFTTCCSHLALGGDSHDYVHPTIEEHLCSEFYNLMQGRTFSNLLKFFKIKRKVFLPEHSYPCGMCKCVFEARKKRAGK